MSIGRASMQMTTPPYCKTPDGGKPQKIQHLNAGGTTKYTDLKEAIWIYRQLNRGTRPDWIASTISKVLFMD